MVVLPYVDEPNAIELAEQLREHIATQIFKADGHDLKISVSIGVASGVPVELKDGRELISHADEALYRAKSAGRNQVQGYTKNQ